MSPPHLVCLFTKDPALVSQSLTNGLPIGYIKYRVEESRSTARPLPCKICIQYYEGKSCTNKANCFKCGDSRPSYSCKNVPNKNYCASCRTQGLRTAASNCHLRSRQSKPITLVKIFRSPETKTTYSDLSKSKETEQNN